MPSSTPFSITVQSGAERATPTINHDRHAWAVDWFGKEMPRRLAGEGA
jgi:hypothetical protein